MQLHQWQHAAIHQFIQSREMIANACTGSGKCLGKGTPILMYDGKIKKVEEIRKGDKIMGDDSTPREVLTITQGVGPLYEVTQKNGEKYVVNEAHILSLKINSNNRLKQFQKNQIIDIPVKEYIQLGYKKHYLKGYKTSTLNFRQKRKSKIDPYFLGLWLADGTERNTAISKPDSEIRKWLKNYATKIGLRLFVDNRACPLLRITIDRKKCTHTNKGNAINPLLEEMRQIGIINNKNIPFEYKVASIRDRQKLLAGLLDGDGYLENGTYEITQKNTQLADDIVFVARSLGLRCSIRKKNKGIKSKNFLGTYNVIRISGRKILELPILIRRKKCLKLNPNKDELRCAITIKKIKNGEYFGFEIDGNKRFVLGDFTVTHNSIFAIECIKYIRENHPDYNILIVAPKIVILETVWLKELAKFGFGPNQVGVYYGYAHEFSKITLTTVASIPNLFPKNVPSSSSGMFDVIICDEIHNMMSPGLIKLLKKDFKYKLGLSASIKRVDQQHWKLLEYFHYNIFEYSMKQAISDGIINKFYFHLVKVNITDADVQARYDELDTELTQALKTYGGFERIMRLPKSDPAKAKVLGLFTQRNDLINNYVKKVQVVDKIILDNIDKKTLLFSQYNKITRAIYWSLKEVVPRTEIIDTHVREVKRQQFLRDFEEGKYNILLSSRIFEEGYNLPKIDCAIFLSSNSTSRQMIQRLGRILRKKDIPSHAYYVYCAGTFEEEYGKKAREFVEELAEEIIVEEY